MKKLFKYLDKIGADYERVQYGSYYFRNAPRVEFDAAIVFFEFCDRETVTRWHTIEKRIERYAARYGYTVYNRGGCLGSVWFTVARAADREKLEDYYFFQRAAVTECEKVMHAHYSKECVLSDPEKTLRSIMDEYGNNYTEFLAARVPVAV